MKRILFVDDDQRMLDGMRDLFRRQRHRWDVVLALGGERALAELERERFDVIVTDMRMPGMDGVALLHKVKERYPSTIRIVLSGDAERGAVLSVVSVSHQFLSKPCNPEVLRTVIEQACGLHALLNDDSIRSIVGKVDRLAAVPRIYRELSDAVMHPDSRRGRFAKILETDPALAAKALQLVNSSYFGTGEKHVSIDQAVRSLGTELLKAVVTAQVFASSEDEFALDQAVGEGFSLDAIQQHAVHAARLAKQFFSDPKRADEAFTAALLHDIGKLVLAASDPGRVGEVRRTCRQTGRPAHVVEKELLGVTHAEVGAYLLGAWGLPLCFVEAVANHHHPERATASAMLVAVHVADALIHPIADESASDPSCGGRLNVAFVEASAFRSELPRWRALADQARREASEPP